jgi:hypothetical protein
LKGKFIETLLWTVYACCCSENRSEATAFNLAVFKLQAVASLLFYGVVAAGFADALWTSVGTATLKNSGLDAIWTIRSGRR